MGRILVIEDNAAMATWLVQSLQEMVKAQITLALNALQARIALRTGPFDLILSDLIVAGQSQYDALEVLELLGNTQPSSPVIILSKLDPQVLRARLSRSAPALSARLEQIQVRGCLVKPFSHSQLRQLLHPFTRDVAHAAPPSPLSPPSALLPSSPTPSSSPHDPARSGG